MKTHVAAVVRVHERESDEKVVKYVLDRHRRIKGRQEYMVLGWDANERLVQVISGFGPKKLLAKAVTLWPDACWES